MIGLEFITNVKTMGLQEIYDDMRYLFGRHNLKWDGKEIELFEDGKNVLIVKDDGVYLWNENHYNDYTTYSLALYAGKLHASQNLFDSRESFKS